MNIDRLKYTLVQSKAATMFLFHRTIQDAVLFSSFAGKQYSDNPRSISEYLHHIAPDIKQYWWARSEEMTGRLPEYVTPVIGDIHEMHRTLRNVRCYITNEYISVTTPKHNGQYFIQTWHGDRGFKKVLLQASNNKGKRIIGDSLLTDLCIAGSSYGIKRYREAFGYHGEILTVGMPRNDRLVNCKAEDIITMKKKLGFPEDQHLLLYAPTFRDHCSNYQTTDIDFERVLNCLSFGGENWLCIMRAHAGVHGFQNNSDKCVDMTDYPDIMDLMIVSDILITDYSSCAGDFLLLHRPVILTVFDQEEYVSQSRKLNVPLSETGYLLAHNQDELESLLKDWNSVSNVENCDQVLTYYGTVETGHATEEVCKRILKAMGEKEIKK